MICTATLVALLLFGDSRCFVGYPTTPTSGSLLAAACPGTAVTQNCRIGRGTYQPGYGATDDPLLQLQTALTAGSYDSCLLDLGLNDWHVTGTTPEQVASRLIDMGRACEDHGAVPILATGWPAGDAGLSGRGAWAAEVRMRTIAAGVGMGWTVIDSWDAFDERSWTTGCASDGVHPNVQACRQTWADYVARRLP
jgi:hypothetical protein